jgi:uncharacterized membrane protein
MSNADTAQAMSPQEIEEGKVFAVLSYVLCIFGVPFWILPLVMRNNDFALFHAKQCLMLWLAGFAGSAIAAALMLVLVGFVLLPVLLIVLLVLLVIGLVGAINGQAKPLPLIGPYAVEWFKGVRKVPG